MIYLHTKFHMSVQNGSLVIAIRWKGTPNIAVESWAPATWVLWGSGTHWEISGVAVTVVDKLYQYNVGH
jgi:hypothetical protein